MRATLPSSVKPDFIFVDDEGVVWGGQREGLRLLRSDDEGVDWGGGLASESIGPSGIEVVETTEEGDWVVHTRYERFYHSNDQGQSWVPGNMFEGFPYVNSFAIDHTGAGQWISHILQNSTLHVSDDQGASWQIGPNLPPHAVTVVLRFANIAVDSTGRWVLVLERFLPLGEGVKWSVFTREPGETSLSGSSWTGPAPLMEDENYDLPDSVQGVRGVACRDTQIEVLYVNEFVSPRESKIISSADGGATWSTGVDLPEDIEKPNGLAIDSSGRWLVSDNTTPGKVWRSSTGSSWFREQDLPSEHIAGIAATPDGDWIAVDDENKRLYLSQNKGVVWDQGIDLPDELSDPADVSYAGGSLYMLDATDYAVYASHTNGVLWDLPRRLPDDGSTDNPDVRGLTIDLNGIFYLFDITTRRFYLSEDEGRTWQYQSTLPAEATTLNGLDVDNRGRLLATNRNPSQAYLSLDKGLTWQAIGQLQDPATVTSGLTIGYGEAVHVPVERITRWGGRISEPETVGVDVVGAGEYLRLRLDDDGAVPSRYALSRLTMRYMMERNIR